MSQVRCINCKHLNKPYTAEKRKRLLESYKRTLREDFVVCLHREEGSWAIFCEWDCVKFEDLVIRDGFYE